MTSLRGGVHTTWQWHGGGPVASRARYTGRQRDSGTHSGTRTGSSAPSGPRDDGRGGCYRRALPSGDNWCRAAGHNSSAADGTV